MPFFGFCREPILCTARPSSPTLERRTGEAADVAASKKGVAELSTATATASAAGGGPPLLLRSSNPPPLAAEGSAEGAAQFKASHGAAREAAAAAVERFSTAGEAAVDKAVAAAAQAVGLAPAAPTELKGKYIALFFGASWCPHCLTFAAQMRRVYTQLRQQQQNEGQPHLFEAVYVPCDRSPADFAAFACTMPWLSLPYGNHGALIRRFGVRSLPTVVLFTPDDQVLTSNAVPIINDLHAAQKLTSLFQRLGPFDSDANRYERLFK
ncbi:uncharacterized protein LOC113146880 [Cyclospora cayetanensis]|uniref:protein-disulfide reductase n=1 Tax=Cyclospora cayetanensis TaxID=88456 RepID=A0A6P6RU14_9EIME|nr:uncharacterized protein LOC113146880 [Cyclospora cayetanensis]